MAAMSCASVLVDFGASRIKSVLWCEEKAGILGERDLPAPVPVPGGHGEVEIDPELYCDAFDRAVGDFARTYEEIDSIWLCSEMHGFLLADLSGKPLTPYISWRDNRASHKEPGKTTALERLSSAPDEILRITGMKPRPGLPLVNLAHMAGTFRFPSPFRLLTLPDWILMKFGEKNPSTNPTMAAGTGFYDIERSAWSGEMLSLAGFSGEKVALGALAKPSEPVGTIGIAGKRINVYGGFGDFQTALLGGGFPSVSTLAVNLGTGSQVARNLAGPASNTGIERRPGIFGGQFAALTHIPSGRALNVFADFVDGCSRMGGGGDIFWNMFKSLEPSEVLGARIAVDLNVFNAAINYRDGGSISRIHEGSSSPREFLAGLARSWLEQYSRAASNLDPEFEEPAISLFGGLSRRAGFIAPVLSELCRRQVRTVTPVTGEETLDGLLAAYRVHGEGAGALRGLNGSN